MIRNKFNEIIALETELGFKRGMELFVEELNTELMRDEYLSENSIDGLLDTLVENFKNSK